METQCRAELKITGEDLAAIIDNQDHSYRTLADAVQFELAKRRYRNRGAPRTCSRELIGQLVREQTRCTHPERARAMEAVLKRRGELFRFVMPSESRNRARLNDFRAA